MGLKEIKVETSLKAKQSPTRTGTFFVLPRASGNIQIFFKYDLGKTPFFITRLNVVEAQILISALNDAVLEIQEMENRNDA